MPHLEMFSCRINTLSNPFGRPSNHRHVPRRQVSRSQTGFEPLFVLLHVGQSEARFVQKSSTLGETIFPNDIGREAVKGATERHDLPTLLVVLDLLAQLIDSGCNYRFQGVYLLFGEERENGRSSLPMDVMVEGTH